MGVGKGKDTASVESQRTFGSVVGWRLIDRFCKGRDKDKTDTDRDSHIVEAHTDKQRQTYTDI